MSRFERMLNGRGGYNHSSNYQSRSEAQEYHMAPIERDGCSIRAINFVETGTYNPEFLRPYRLKTDKNALSLISDALNEVHGSNLSPTQLGGYAGGLVNYSSEVTNQDLAYIENGFDTPRLSFMLEITDEDLGAYEISGGGDTFITYITGYTDRYDLVEGRNGVCLPDSLVMYVSNVHRVSMGRRKVMSNNQLIVPQYQQANNNNMFLIRPTDVFGEAMVNEKANISGIPSFNQTSALTGVMAKASKSTNLTPARYLSSTLNAYNHANKNQSVYTDPYSRYDNQASDSTEGAYTQMMGMVREDTPYSVNSFLHRLRNETRSFGSTATFTWGEIKNLFGREVDDMAKLHRRSRVQRAYGQNNSRFAVAGESASWDTTDNGGYNAVFATALKQAIPGLALENLIYAFRLEATNMMGGYDDISYRNITIHISDVIFSAKIQDRELEYRLIENLKQSIVDNILLDVSLNNDVPFDIVCDIDWRNDSFFRIGIDQDQLIEFSTATFTNSLTPPILTYDYNFGLDFINDLKSITNSVSNRRVLY